LLGAKSLGRIGGNIVLVGKGRVGRRRGVVAPSGGVAPDPGTRPAKAVRNSDWPKAGSRPNAASAHLPAQRKLAAEGCSRAAASRNRIPDPTRLRHTSRDNAGSRPKVAPVQQPAEPDSRPPTRLRHTGQPNATSRANAGSAQRPSERGFGIGAWQLGAGHGWFGWRRAEWVEPGVCPGQGRVARQREPTGAVRPGCRAWMPNAPRAPDRHPRRATPRG